MPNRVLFVDDEQNLLHRIERRLGTRFDIATASSGSDALKKLDELGPFAVVVTNMRMPKMDGIEFIKQAREQAPDTVYIMLTGNHDQATAIQALNEGHVFRFLTKPCQSTDLIAAVEVGLRQYQLVSGERELLQNTFCGAVSVLTDLLALSHPHIFHRTERIQSLVRELQVNLGLEERWEFKLAARLALLGFALLPEEEHCVSEAGVCSGTDFESRFRRAASIGQRLIERIPRLAIVARIIGRQPDVDGSVVIQFPRTDDAKVDMGATLLRVAVQWDSIARRRFSGRRAVSEMKRLMPNLSIEMLDALSELPCDDAGGDEIEVIVADLNEGMVLGEDIVSTDGDMLMRKGRRLNWTIIERLRQSQLPGESKRTVKVLASTVRSLAETSYA